MKRIMFGIALLLTAVLMALCFPQIVAATLVIGAIGLVFAFVGYIFHP